MGATNAFDRHRSFLSRPNFNWGDNAADLTDYADDSNADDVEVAMSALRGESLAKDHGIVGDILNVAKVVIGPVKNLRIVGRREGEAKETAVSLKRHQEKRSFPAPDGTDPRTERESFEVVAKAFVNEVAEVDAVTDG